MSVILRWHLANGNGFSPVDVVPETATSPPLSFGPSVFKATGGGEIIAVPLRRGTNVASSLANRQPSVCSRVAMAAERQVHLPRSSFLLGSPLDPLPPPRPLAICDFKSQLL